MCVSRVGVTGCFVSASTCYTCLPPPYVNALPLKKMSLNPVSSHCQGEDAVRAHERFQLQTLKPAQCFPCFPCRIPSYSQTEEGSTGLLETKALLTFLVLLDSYHSHTPTHSVSYSPEVTG